MITSEKLVGSENYLSWSASVELWFMGQSYEDHLVTQEADIPEAKGLYTNDIQRLYKAASSIVNVRQQDMDLSTYFDQIASLKEEFLTVMPLTTDVGDQRIQIDKFFMVLTLIGLHPDLETVRDQILGSSSVPSLDDVFARRLCISSTQTLPSDNTSDSSMLLHGRPPRTAHVAQSSDPQSPQPPSSSTSQGIFLTDNSGASDHISGNKDLFSSITTTSALPTVTLANGSQTMAKGPEYGEDDWYRIRLGHPSLSKFQKMVPSFSSLSSLACESCQLGKHTRVSFPERLNNRAKSPFELVHTDIWGPCRTATNFLPKPQNASSWDIPDFKRVIVVIPLRLIATFSPLIAFSPTSGLSSPSSCPVPPSLAEVPADSLLSLRLLLPRLCLLLLTYPLLFGKSTPEALSHPGWRQAMVDEMAALHSGTWDLVVLPSGKSTVGCRWVYTVKVGPDGQVDRLKARLVAKGYTQVYGSDYGDTFSPVAKIASVRLLLSMAAMRSWPLYQLDIKNAFLHGDLAEEVYMEQPPGFVAQGSLEFGMFRSTADHSVFYHHNSSGQCIYLVVYVDDIVITGSDQNGIQKLKQHLFTHFQTKDLGKLKYFLGIEIAQSSSGVVLSQRKYALDIWKKPVCKLNYLTITRPDISFLTSGQGVLYENRGHTQVVGYTDADWADSPTDRRSTSGYCVFIGGNLISWKSKKQDVVARSSAEAEYRAMTLATCELIWLKHLLWELRFEKDEQMKLICDNQAALHIASIQSSMKGPNTLKLTVTSLERESHQDV
ncbi:Retrovirus-related Pol polyprotein from transposon RE1 [Vitis vinifera]|uniref:Retrovirus-related Pol polyprotein from transposon RE1 n=1 Tax=Vitis vinifera TaxID=29760 RepID=A0A438FS04_VITVI|nr:Retrovirus-related Pol polyprotein from transposon RE1 [Vitis vinifera]